MLRSLRFRLPVLFLAGIALTGLVSTAIAFGLFQDYTQDQARSELRREASGLTQLYAEQANKAAEQNRPPPFFAATKLERASGNRLFYVGLPFFSGQESGLTRLPQSTVDFPALQRGQVLEFDFVPPGETKTFLAVAHPLYLEKQGPPFGALIVATAQTELRDRLETLLERLAIAFLVGILVTAGLAWYLSGRITRPVLALAKAADEVAEGRYDVSVPKPSGRDEIADLADSFRQMATRLAEALGVIAEEAGRLERLVGDVLDLAKLDTRRFTVLREEVDMARLLDRAFAVFGEEAKRRDIEYSQEVAAKPVIVSDGD